MQQAEIVAWANARMQSATEPALETGYRLHHGQRVARLALALAARETLSVDRGVLFIGALLHDVGKSGAQGKGHGPRGARLIEEEIAHLFTADELRRVTTIVASHYLRPKSKFHRNQPDPGWPAEVLLVQDADALDHFGANGVWIAHHWAAKEQRSQTATIEEHFGPGREWHDEALQAMNFPAAVAELKQRMAFTDAFMREWQLENCGELVSSDEKS